MKCVAHPLVSYRHNNHAHAVTSVLSKMVQFSEHAFICVAIRRMGVVAPTFPMDQFWDSSKSDKKSLGLPEGYCSALSAFDFGQTSKCATSVSIDIH